MKYILIILFLAQNVFAQISGGTVDVNILGGSVTLTGSSAVTQSGAWGVSLLAGSNAIGSITNSSFGISGTLPSFATTQTFNIGTGAFVDRTTAASPYSQRLTDGTSFYDARSIRALTSSDVVTVANPTTSVTVSSSALPTGAATSALQTSGNASLTSIDGKMPALGQTTMAGSQPVAIASNQSAIPVTGTFFQATQPVSGSVTATISGTPTVTVGNASLAVTGPLTDAQLRATAVPVSGTVSTGGLTDTQLRASAVPVSLTSTTVSNFPATQTVNGTVTANLGTIAGVATETTASAINTKLPSGLTVTSTRLLTDGSGVTQPVSASSLPLPTGAATSANQSTMITTLNTIASNTGAQATDTLSTGTITALNGAVAINAQGAYTVSALITGTWTATLVAEGLMADSATWVQLPMNVVQTTVPYPTTFTVTTNSTLLITGGGYTQVRIRAQAFTSGTVNVFLNASLAQQTIFASQLGNWNVTQTPVPNNLGVTAVGTTGAAVTLTFPAVAAQFHYIDSIEITAYSTAARTGNATPITCTTANFPGNPSFTFATAAVIGSTDVKQLYNANRPIKSVTANTNTTITCPATTGVIWRMNTVYSTSP